MTRNPDNPAPISAGLRIEGRRERRSAAHAAEGKLAASLAHEINNPIESLLNLLYLMRSESTLTEKGHGYLVLAEEEVQRVSQIAHAALEGFREMTGPKGRECADPGGLRSRPLPVTVRNSRYLDRHPVLR